jgi:hypothetical protein
MKSKISVITAITLFVGLAIPARSHAQEQQIKSSKSSTLNSPTIVEFNAPHAGSGPGQGTFPQSNNAAGAVTGYYVTGQNVYHGFLRAPDRTITSFDPPGAGTLKNSAQGTVPLSINWGGEIVGQYQDENYLYHGFLRTSDGTFTRIDAPGAGTEANQGTVATNISPEGVIAGYFYDASNVFHGFARTRNGAITTFDAPGAGSGAYQGTLVTFTEHGINAEGEITGWYIDGSGTYHGYVRSADGNTFTTVDGPGSIFTVLGGVTPDGTIMGYFADASGLGHGLLGAPDGSLTTFDDPLAGTGPGQGTYAFDINSGGTITGQYTDSGNTNHGFVRTPNAKFTTFDAPHAAKGNFLAGTRPATINSAGAVTGYYIDQNNVNHGFVWTR